MSTTKSFRLRSSSLNTIRLRRIFDVFDDDGDGEITVEELNRALTKLGLEETPGDLESFLAGRSGLGFEDFADLHRSLGDSLFGSQLTEEEDGGDSDLVEAFHVFDEDGDGFICPRELQSVLKKLGLGEEGRDISRVNQMICSVDRNHDGLVDFSEFKIMMSGIAAASS
ncbi:calcium-binding protein CML42-like [Wolffia australiana]